MAIGHAQTAQRLARLLSNNYSLLPSHSLSLSLSLALSRVFVLAGLFLPPSLQDDRPPPPASSSSSSPVYSLYLMLLVFPWLRGQSEDTPPAYIGPGETHLTGYLQPRQDILPGAAKCTHSRIHSQAHRGTGRSALNSHEALLCTLWLLVLLCLRSQNASSPGLITLVGWAHSRFR